MNPGQLASPGCRNLRCPGILKAPWPLALTYQVPLCYPGPPSYLGKRSGATDLLPTGRSGLGQAGREYLRFPTVGLQFVITICFGVGIGWRLDVKLETKPWLTLVFGLLSPPVAFYHLYRAVYGTNLVTGEKPEEEQS